MNVSKFLEKTENPLHRKRAQKNVMNANQLHGDEINGILQGIDFSKNRIVNPEDPDFLTAMKSMRGLLVQRLDNAPALSDDLSAIDAKLEYLAHAWYVAVKQGCYGKAKWAMTAVNKGVKEFRTNVPPDQSHRTEEVLKERADILDMYISVVKNAEVIDISEQRITAAKAQIAEHQNKLDPIREEISEARQDPAKLKALAKVMAVQMGKMKITELNDHEAELLATYEEGIVLAKSIKVLQHNIELEQADMDNARNLLDAGRASLTL